MKMIPHNKIVHTELKRYGDIKYTIDQQNHRYIIIGKLNDTIIFNKICDDIKITTFKNSPIVHINIYNSVYSIYEIRNELIDTYYGLLENIKIGYVINTTNYLNI